SSSDVGLDARRANRPRGDRDGRRNLASPRHFDCRPHLGACRTPLATAHLRSPASDLIGGGPKGPSDVRLTLQRRRSRLSGSGMYRIGWMCVCALAVASNARAQEHWEFMQDGILFAEFNHQGGPRGGNEFVAPNWWMGMATRDTSRGRLTVTAMFSLDPATDGQSGYGELFQAGEALNGRPLIDRQHPHDAFMQLAMVWRTPITPATGFTIAGGPAGEPALGPVAFMHRPSAMDNPTAPLSHHTVDSTHVAFGVVTAAIDHGPFVVEGSLFNGREPDENRWDFDFGRLDSFSGRVWYRPNDEWELQASSGRLVSPEELEPGNTIR